MLSRARSAALAAALLAAGADGAPAAEYYVDPSFQNEFGYNSDPSFASGQSSTGSIEQRARLIVDTGVRTPSLRINATGWVDYTYFPQDTGLNSSDQSVTLGATHADEGTVYGLSGAFVRNTTRSSEEDDTDRVLPKNERRNLLSVSPTWQRQITPLDRLSLSGFYRYVYYSTDDLDDNVVYGGSGLWSHSLSRRTQWQSQVSGFIFDTTNGRTHSDSASAITGFAHQFSQRISLRLLAGPSWARQRSERGSTTNRNQRLTSNETESTLGYDIESEATLQYDPLTRFSFGINRNFSPSTSSGNVQEVTSATFSVNRTVIHDVTVAARTSFSRRGSFESNDDSSRDEISVSPSVTWRLMDDISVGLSYRFRWQKFNDDGDTNTSNAVFATLTYDIPRLSWSR